jgi:hypothetical protein
MVTDGDIWKARKTLTNLQTSLRLIVKKDSELEVRGMAIPVLDAALDMVRGALGNNPIVNAVAGVISVETIEAGEPLRASDVLLVADMFLGALPTPAPSIG